MEGKEKRGMHGTHGNDAKLEKSLKKVLTYGFENDILIKLTREREANKRTLKIEQQERNKN